RAIDRTEIGIGCDREDRERAIADHVLWPFNAVKLSQVDRTFERNARADDSSKDVEAAGGAEEEGDSVCRPAFLLPQIPYAEPPGYHREKPSQNPARVEPGKGETTGCNDHVADRREHMRDRHCEYERKQRYEIVERMHWRSPPAVTARLPHALREGNL